MAYDQSTSQRATMFSVAIFFRFLRPTPPMPTPAMLSLSLGATCPRVLPRTWLGTIVKAAAPAAAVMPVLMKSLLEYSFIV